MMATVVRVPWSRSCCGIGPFGSPSACRFGVEYLLSFKRIPIFLPVPYPQQASPLKQISERQTPVFARRQHAELVGHRHALAVQDAARAAPYAVVQLAI